MTGEPGPAAHRDRYPDRDSIGKVWPAIPMTAAPRWRSLRCAPTAGWAICWPGRRPSRCSRWHRPEDCLESYFVVQGAIPVRAPRPAQPATLLDQVPEVAVTVRGRPLIEVIRPVYDALGG